ncbi:girdin-like, partial [Rhincodon typus]|uniref:girdin-like n=1 Tax=Rhincodon typus TaxID=259920 RepID=UPI00202E66EF
MGRSFPRLPAPIPPPSPPPSTSPSPRPSLGQEEREYSRALLETKTILEEQLEAARSRCDRLHELEKEGLLLRSALNDLEMEREADRQRIEELMEENLSLEMEVNKRMEDSVQRRWRADSISEEFPHAEFPQRPLSDEVNEVTSGQLMKLERENQELRRKADELHKTSIDADTSQSAKLLSLERENQQLQKMFRVWGRKEVIQAGQGDYALEIVGKLLEFFANKFNISYPMTKMDLIAVPSFESGGMENWGLIIFREANLLYNAEEESESSLQAMTLVLAHEFTHQ